MFFLSRSDVGRKSCFGEKTLDLQQLCQLRCASIGPRADTSDYQSRLPRSIGIRPCPSFTRLVRAMVATLFPTTPLQQVGYSSHVSSCLRGHEVADVSPIVSRPAVDCWPLIEPSVSDDIFDSREGKLVSLRV